ncbi:MAG: MFS transporter [Oscillospiraceae bacterium]|nr:MFS transporter [Ruminococcus sp.]MCD8345723.1 MFS transporter [Oscillospiraceae bacterium]
MKLSYKNTIYCSYVGYITQAVVNLFAPLLFVTFSSEFGISVSQITLITTLNFLTQLIVDLLSTKIIDKLGYRVCIVAAHIFSATGLVMLAVLPTVLPSAYAGLLISVIVYAVGGGLIEVLISPIVEACPTDDKASAMSLLHSFYCWGAVLVILVSTAFFSIFGIENWRIMSCVWALVPAVNAFMFTKVPIETLTEDGSSMKIRDLLSSKVFILFIIMILCAGASELAMSQWSSAFAESGLGVSKAMGDLAGPCLFAILMGIARVINSKISHRIDILPVMIGSAGLCVISYILTVLSPVPLLSLLGCALCGLSVGVMWPGVFSLASAKFPKGGTALFALLAFAGDVGCTSGPTLVGFVSGLNGDSLKSGLSAAMIFPIVLIICCLAYMKLRKNPEKSDR